MKKLLLVLILGISELGNFDTGPGNYKAKWKNKGKCWDTAKSNSYDVVLPVIVEHIPF